MKKPPQGWPQIAPVVFYDDPAAAIEWLCRVTGFQVRLKVEGENGEIVHSELEFGEGLIMVGGTANIGHRANPVQSKSPRSLGGGNTQQLCLFVDDVDAHFRHAKEAGAKVIDEPTTFDYGEEYWSDRSYRLMDPEGHEWWFMQRVRDPKPRAR